MAIGSFIDGVFKGMNMRETRDNNRADREMDKTRFEREGESHGWDRDRHEVAMAKAKREAAKGNGYKRSNVIRGAMAGYDGSESDEAPAGGGGSNGLSTFGAIPSNGGYQAPPLSYGTPAAAPAPAAAPVELSSLPAVPAAPSAPLRLVYDPQRGLIPGNVG